MPGMASISRINRRSPNGSDRTVPSALFYIPSEGAPRVLDDQAMFDRETLFFGKDKKAARVVCASRALVHNKPSPGQRHEPESAQSAQPDPDI